MEHTRRDSAVNFKSCLSEIYEVPRTPGSEYGDPFYALQLEESLDLPDYEQSVLPELDRPSDHIRLFRLQRGGFHDDLSGSLEIFHIDRCPPYRAMSYEWGKDVPTYKVFMDSGVLQIMLNLFMFLTNYRSNMSVGDQVEYLWIDFICVNQKDKSEKRHQVDLMSKIFTKAFEVVAWLGPDYDNFNCFKRHRRLSQGHCSIRRCVSVFGTTGFKSTFWDRLWTQQEMVLAPRVIFMLGKRKVIASDLQNDHEWDEELVKRQPALRAALRNEHDDGERAFTLLRAIKLFSHKICHDPRDKVFGLQGMVCDEQRIPVDYHLTTSAVFQQAVEAVFKHEKFPEPEWKEYHVMKYLMKLGRNMGQHYDDALAVCQKVADAKVQGGYHFGEFLRRHSNAVSFEMDVMEQNGLDRSRLL